MTTSTNSTRLTSKEACTLAHKIRRETGCSLAEAFKQAYDTTVTSFTLKSGNTYSKTANGNTYVTFKDGTKSTCSWGAYTMAETQYKKESTTLYYTQKDLDKIFSDKVAELINNGYTIHVPTMNGSQGERAFVTFIKDGQLYRLSMDDNFQASFREYFVDHYVIISLGKSTDNEAVLNGRTFWKNDVEAVWSFEVAQVASWRRKTYQDARFIPMDRLEECEAKATARIKARYGTTRYDLPSKYNKPALVWVKTVKGYKGTKLDDIQKVVKNAEDGSYYIYFTSKQGKTICLNTKTAK